MKALKAAAESRGIEMTKIAWNMSPETYEHYADLIEELSSTDPDFEYEKYQGLRDDLMNLEGLPRDYDPEYDIIVPVIQQAIIVSVH